MWRLLAALVLVGAGAGGAGALLCYNCSSTQTAPGGGSCAGGFVVPTAQFNSSKDYLINCTGDSAMCFVRSWSARARHAWIVQRGCYRAARGDPLVVALAEPLRAMSCKHQRLVDAEYNLCLCQADWCNAGARGAAGAAPGALAAAAVAVLAARA